MYSLAWFRGATHFNNFIESSSRVGTARPFHKSLLFTKSLGKMTLSNGW